MNTVNTFAFLASARVGMLQQVMTTVLNGEQAVLVPILGLLLLMFFGRQFFLVMFGHLEMAKFMNSAIRAAVIVFLVHGTVNFNTYVAQKVFTNVPQALSTLGAGSYIPASTGQSSATQFDQVSAAGDAITAQINSQVQITSPSTWLNGMTADFSDAAFQMELFCIFGVWFLGLNLLAIALCLGPPLLCFEFFERTRHFVDTWISWLVSFACHGLASSIVLGMEMQSLQDMLKSANGIAGQNLPAAASMMVHAVGNGILDLLLIVACPLAFSLGAGATTALAAPAAFAAGRVMMAGATAGKAGGRAATSAVGKAGAAYLMRK